MVNLQWLKFCSNKTYIFFSMYGSAMRRKYPGETYKWLFIWMAEYYFGVQINPLEISISHWSPPNDLVARFLYHDEESSFVRLLHGQSYSRREVQKLVYLNLLSVFKLVFTTKLLKKYLPWKVLVLFFWFISPLFYII